MNKIEYLLQTSQNQYPSY